MKYFLCILALACGFGLLRESALGQTGQFPPLPKMEREYRGVWVATVANIDWPSKPGLSSDQQKVEAIKILDKAAELKLNVIVFQVRTSCDALYESSLEPWSYFLSGKQGEAPQPPYDPLRFWIEESHRRGMELHAWFNPFRAKNNGETYEECSDHISQTKPNLVKAYGNDKTHYLWLDPGETEAREHSLRVFMDVVNRYDVDGIHIDDYFYPYPLEGVPFPDEPAWEKYLESGGKLSRDDWRRSSMNDFIQRLYGDIKRIKPHCKFGISPFGIWKPGFPESVAGFSQYDKLYADAKLWLNEGWCDYYTPQLYWSITAKKQSFPALLAWWSQENVKSRHLAPGLFTGRIGDKNRPYSPEQIESQVFTARHMPGSHGTVHFSMKSLIENREGIADRLKENPYSDPAVLPACPWIESKGPGEINLDIKSNDSSWTVTWQSERPDEVRRWCLYSLHGNRWIPKILGSAQTTQDFAKEEKEPVRAIAVSGIDGAGNESPASLAIVSPDS